MLSIKRIKAGGEDYYLDLAREDYYFNGGEPPGKWMGGACSLLGLAPGSTVERDQLKRLMQGFHPTVGGGKDDPDGPPGLVQNAGKDNRTAGLDLTFSSPKSVSVIWSQADEDLRREIVSLAEETLKETLTFAEDAYGYSRTGKQGSGKRIKAKLVFATFEHGTSRACDPQLHWHGVLQNIGYCADGKTRALDLKPFYKKKMLLGAIYRSKYAHKLRRKFGLKAYRKGNCFEINGVPQAAMDAKSKRRKQILKDLHDKGLSSAAAASQSAVETRPDKEHRPRHELFQEWREENLLNGFDDAVLKKLILKPDSTDFRKNINKLLVQTLKEAEKRYSHFTDDELLKEALYAAPKFAIPFEDLVGPVEKFLESSSEIVPIPMMNGTRRFTTKAVLQQELELLDHLTQLQNRAGLNVSDSVFIKTMGKKKGITLNDEQRDAVEHLLRGGSAIRVVQGYAGTGKTASLRYAVDGWIKSGFNVVGACFTAKAAHVLQNEIGIPCDTINMTLADFNGSLTDTLTRFGKHTFKQMFRELRGKKTYAYRRPKPVDINRKTVILVDEASMVNLRHMVMLMKWANKNNAMLVLTGDQAQLPAVEGGSPFQSISRRVGFTELTDIKRQRDYWAREAAYYLARGEIAKALELYDQRGLLNSFDSADEALNKIINDWDEKSWDRLTDTSILALTNEQVHQANLLAQQKRKDRGLLKTTGTRTIRHLRNDGDVEESEVYVGDRIRFTKNNRKLGFSNKDSGTVVRFTTNPKNRFQHALKVRLDNGQTVIVPTSFQHIRLSYASTVYSAQGETYGEVYVLLAGGYQNLPTSYVQGTRSRFATHFYTTRELRSEINEFEDSRLVSEMEREVDLSLAVDLFAGADVRRPDFAQLQDKVIEDWKNSNSYNSLIVTANQGQANEFNRRCHEILYAMAQADWDNRLRQGTFNSSDSFATYQHEGHELFVGCRVSFADRGTLGTSHVEHDLGFVRVIDHATQKVEIVLDRGPTLDFPMNRLPKLNLGYAASFEQASQARYRKQFGFLVDPTDWMPRDEAYRQDIFTQSPFKMNHGYDFAPSTMPATAFKFEEPTTYQSHSQYTHMAVEWQQKAYQANQQWQQSYEQSWQQVQQYKYGW